MQGLGDPGRVGYLCAGLLSVAHVEQPSDRVEYDVPNGAYDEPEIVDNRTECSDGRRWSGPLWFLVPRKNEEDEMLENIMVVPNPPIMEEKLSG